MRLSVFILIGIAMAAAVAAEPADSGQSVDELLSRISGVIGHKPSWPFLAEVAPRMAPQAGQVVTLEVKLAPNFECGQAMISLTDIENLDLLGMTEWPVTFSQGDTLRQFVDVRLPEPVDTSGLTLWVKGCGQEHRVWAYFVGSADGVTYRFGNPHWDTPRTDPNAPQEMLGRSTEELLEQAANSGTAWTGYYDEFGNQYDEPPWERTDAPPGWEYDPDRVSYWFKDSNYTVAYMWDENGKEIAVDPDSVDSAMRARGRLQAELRRKEKLEQSPLTDIDVETMMIDGEQWTRRRGETTFHKLPSQEELEAYQDSVRRLTFYDLSLDLSERDKYEVAKSLVDSLIPMDSAGFYRAKVRKETARELKKAGIQFYMYPNTVEPPPKPRGRPAPEPGNESSLYNSQDDRLIDPSREWATIFFDNLETGMGEWLTGDSLTANGTDTWGWDDERPYGGWFSSWCAADGDQYETYDDNMKGYMRTWDVIDLSNYGNVYVDYYLWWITESGYDYVSMWYRLDGGQWTMHGERRSGSSGGWIGYRLPIPDPVEELEIMFLFESDDLFHNFEGAYMDEIVVRGDEILPNLTWDTPWNWDGPITVSHEEYSPYTDNPLYTNVPSYINWGIVNNGGGDAGSFKTAVYVDNVYRNSYWTPSLGAGDVDSWYNNHQHTFTTTGEHTVKIVIDSGNYIAEDDETDNVYSEPFFLSPDNPI